MLFLDLFLKFGGASLLLLMAALACRDIRQINSAKYFIGMCISVAALLLSYTAHLIDVPKPLETVLRLTSTFNVLFIWLFGLAFFDDNFRLRPLHWAASLFYVVPCFAFKFHLLGFYPDIPFWVEHLADFLALALLIYLLVKILRGRADDLIESRRALRLYLLLALIAVAIITISLDFLMPSATETNISFIRGLVSFPMIVWACFWFASVTQGNYKFALEPQLADAETAIDPRDAGLRDKLLHEMSVNKAYLEPELNIRKLAETLGAPEHRLRALINQGMGYRNFSAFVNAYRIEAVKAAFSDPERLRTPILTIALDAGFNSLPPFNRAFKALENMTPTAYRQALLSEADQN